MGIIDSKIEYEAENLDEIKENLKNYGFTIVTNILTPEECSNLKNDTWKVFENLTEFTREKIKREDNNSWSELKAFNPEFGINFHCCGVGQSEVMWKVRINEKILKIFSFLWNSVPRDLLVSFDGFSFAKKQDNNSSFYRTEEDLNVNDFHTFQSFLTCENITENFSFFESSNKKEIRKCFNTFFKVYEENKNILNNDFINFFRTSCKEVKLKCPKGSLLIWDSRLIYNLEQSKINDLCGFYLSYYPRIKVREDVINNRIVAFTTMKTSDFVVKKINLYPDMPEEILGDYDMLFNKLEKPNIDDLSKKLIGY